MNVRSVFRAVVVGSAVALIRALDPSALAVNWSNTGIGNWVDGSNWATGSPPIGAEVGLINNGGTALIDVTMNVFTGSVTLADTTGTTGNLRMTGGSLTTTNTDFRIGGNAASGGGTAVFDQSGGSVLLNAGNVNVGFGTTAKGTYNLSGGSLQLNSANIIAIGNRGIGILNQTGGTIFVRGNGTNNTLAGVINLGRNVAASGGSGTVTLSGGTIAVAKVQFGNAVQTSGDPSTNVFNLQGSGRLLTDSISIVNTAAANSFNFTGGTLVAESIGLSLTNNGGDLSPAMVDFSLPGNNIDELPIDPIGTTIFGGNSSYTQGAAGTLSIDIAALGFNDFVSIGSDPSLVASASISGKISVRLLNGYEPALGSTFDILSADSITNSASIIGTTPAGNIFAPSTVIGGDGREVLRLTVVPEPNTGFFLIVASAVLFSSRFRRRTLV
ncbi:hypothetical protein ACXR0O_03720 [Verrucomicrobiota bacterium sgz303538]